ncbi:ABC transporter permease [Arcobacter sp. 15-2]|uniref:ABC transporter permease n=1 Tax=Arcobacter sp. 15-2 TaxID=3374109 RepID=UPI00399C7124
MNTKLINFIIRKYLKFDKKNPFISISAILAFLGVGIGVMVLIVAMAIMNGTAKEFEKKLFTMNYPLSIYPKVDGMIDENLLKDLESKFPDLLFSPYLSSQVMIQSDESMSGGVVFGVNKEKEAAINSIYKEAVKDIDTFNKYDIIVGQGIKDELFLYSNQKVTLYFTTVNPSGFSLMPKMKRFVYSGDFKSGLTAYDKAYMYTSIDSLRTILKKHKKYYDGIHIYSDNPFKDKERIEKELPSFGVGIVGWWQQNGNFFAAMEMEKQALFVVLMLIILIASLNIISSLLMTVMSRRKEIALLLSLGASQKEVKHIFLRLGIIIGYSGIILGILLGFFGIYLLENFDIVSLPADVYGSTKLPLVLDNIDFVSIIAGSMVIVFLSAYYPAKKATQIDVLDVLRNE